MKDEAAYRRNRYHNISSVRKSRIEATKKWQAKNPDKIKKYHEITQKRYSDIMHELKSNGCAICGYDKCDTALEFHHVNPQDKKFTCGVDGFIIHNSKDFKEELNKCILLCANCHKELHTKEREVNKHEKLDIQ